MDGKREKMVSKVQFVKKSQFIGGLFDVTALTFFKQKLKKKKIRNQILRILSHDGDKLINPDSCKRKKTRKKCHDLLKKCNGPDVRAVTKKGKPLNWHSICRLCSA